MIFLLKSWVRVTQHGSDIELETAYTTRKGELAVVLYLGRDSKDKPFDAAKAFDDVATKMGYAKVQDT